METNKNRLETLNEFVTRRLNENISNYNDGYFQALIDVYEMVEETKSLDYVYESIEDYLVEAKSEGQLKSRLYSVQKSANELRPKIKEDEEELKDWNRRHNTDIKSQTWTRDEKQEGRDNRVKIIHHKKRFERRAEQLQQPRPIRTPKPLSQAYPSRKPFVKKPFPLQKPSRFSNIKPVPDAPNQWQKKENINDVIARMKRNN